MQQDDQNQCVLRNPTGACNPDKMPEVANASRFLIKPGEHTWGIASIQDYVNWTNTAFNKAKNRKNFFAVCTVAIWLLLFY